MMSSFEAGGRLPRPEFVPARAASPAAPDAGAVAAPAPAVDVESRIRSAFEEGVAAGRAELPWQEAQALESALQAVENAAETLAASANAPVLEMQRAIVELACALTEHLVEAQVASDLDALTPLLTESLAMLSGLEPIVIQLSPADHETLQAGDARALQSLAERSGATIEADPSVAPHSARVRGGESVAKLEISKVVERLRGFLVELAATPLPEDGR